MYISLKWLKQYLSGDINIPDEDLRERVSIAFAEVEDIVRIGNQLKNVLVGQIQNIEPHKSSEKLQIATVDIGSNRTRKVVCAARNIFEGAKVPIVTPGGVVLNPKQALTEQQPITIKEAEVAGETSQGMLCSQKELGIGEDHQGIWILPEDIDVGTDMVELLQDTILEIENKSLTNRPDCFCHEGIAREIGAIFKIPFKEKTIQEKIVPTESMPLEVRIENKELCKRYSGVVIKDVTIQPSPLWLQTSLLRVGVRPVNNVVDATNYVMMDMGQPMHAFDYHKLHSPKIIIRSAKQGEKMTVLTHEEKELQSNHLVIADEKKPIALAGIIGGDNSDIDEKTKDIIIESANFEMYNLRRTTRELGLRTEANTRFEKGLDPNITISGLKQVVQLITDIAGGEIASELIDEYPEPVTEKELTFDTFDVTRLLGIEISRNEILEILRLLKLEILSPESSTNQITIKIPTFRRDLSIKEDIIEEIARLYGYDKFQPTLPTKTIKSARVNRELRFDRKTRKLLASLGFDEMYTYAFINEEMYSRTNLDIKKCIAIRNPLSAELTHLRTTIIPSLLDKVKLNLSYFDELAVFELARVYYKEKNDENLPKQPKKVALLETNNDKKSSLLLTLKGKIEELISQLQLSGSFTFAKQNTIPYLHPNYQAEINLGSKHVGHIGIINEDVRDKWDISKQTAVAELDFGEILSHHIQKKTYSPVSIFPHVERDLSFWIDEKITIDEILTALNNSEALYLQTVDIIDIYKHKKKPSQKSVAITIILQSETETLSEEQISADIEHIKNTINKLGGKIRNR